jgi:alkanesulfonate monooxygenase SsuD/methylene tetrahydromethanopterin reductase-like flavin-dependent oxidoreductase (luciferase family)
LVAKLKVGFVLGPETGHLSHADAAALEGTGCDSLWYGGQLIGPNASLEVITSLARMTAITQRVALGSAILKLPLYPAVLVAKQFAEIDLASGGRAALGVGVGGNDLEMAALGVSAAERGSRTDEALEVIRALWQDDTVTRMSSRLDLHGVSIAPRPSCPPIYVAGRAPAAARRAVRFGDGWMPTMLSPSAYARSVETIRQYAHEVRRPLDSFEWLNVVYVSVDDDSEVAWQRASQIFGAEINVAPAVARTLLAKTAAVGTPDDVAEALTRFCDAGVTHFVLRACADAHDYQEQIARIMAEVVPLIGRSRRLADHSIPPKICN